MSECPDFEIAEAPYKPSLQVIEVESAQYYNPERYEANVRLARRLVESHHEITIDGQPWIDPEILHSVPDLG